MPVREAKVPLALLQDQRLSASAKVVWAVLHWDAQWRAPQENEAQKPSIAELARRTGLTKPTIRRAFSQLQQSGWHWAPERRTPGGSVRRAAHHHHVGPWISTPVELFCDPSLSPQARVVYGLLQIVPGFRRPNGESTYRKIGRLFGKDPRTVKKAMRELASAGWLEWTQANQCAPVQFALRNPAAERLERELIRVKRRLERAEFLGEALMREYLSLLVDSDQFEDDAAPGFLVNPLTEERLQFDRYYPPDVAFEFNGPQHYHATERFTAQDAAKQRARDLIKLGICVEKGIKLIVVHAEDLTLEAMRRKVEGILPLRGLEGREELAEFLEENSRPYRRWARRQRRGAPTEHPR